MRTSSPRQVQVSCPTPRMKSEESTHTELFFLGSTTVKERVALTLLPVVSDYLVHGPPPGPHQGIHVSPLSSPLLSPQNRSEQTGLCVDFHWWTSNGVLSDLPLPLHLECSFSVRVLGVRRLQRRTTRVDSFVSARERQERRPPRGHGRVVSGVNEERGPGLGPLFVYLFCERLLPTLVALGVTFVLLRGTLFRMERVVVKEGVRLGILSRFVRTKYAPTTPTTSVADTWSDYRYES